MDIFRTSVRSATLFLLRGHFEEKIQAQEKENDVRRPPRQKRWKLANPAHGFQKLGDRPIDDSKSDSERHTAHRAARPHQKSERDRQKHADRREQGEGKFFVPLHRQSGDVKARTMQTIDITPQLPPAHLERLSNLPVEITGGLSELWQRSNWRKSLVPDNRAVRKISHPTPFESPHLLALRPPRARRKDAAPHLKRRRIDFQHREPAKKVLRGVEEIVIVDFIVFTEDPSLRVGVDLRRAAFDQVVKRVLPLVGIGQVGIVENDHGCGQGQPCKKQRHGQTIHTDAAGLDGHDFIVLAHDPQRHEYRDQRPQRRELIEQIGSKVAEIIDHDKERNAVARNVVEKLEKGEGLKKKDERPHQQRKIIKETPQYIHVQQLRETSAGRRQDFLRDALAIHPVRLGGSAASLGSPAAQETFSGFQIDYRPEPLGFAAELLHPRHERQPQREKNGIGDPDSGRRRQRALPRKPRPQDGQQIIRRDENYRE